MSGRAYKGRESKSRASKAAGLIVALLLIAAVFFLWRSSSFSCATGGGNAQTAAKTELGVPRAGQLSIYCIDVGQGDAFVLVSPSGRTMLVDGGEAIYASRVKTFIHSLGIEKLDFAVGTHPHSDHIGAMPEIIEGFEIGEYIMPDAPFESRQQTAVLDALSESGVESRFVWSGDTLDWDESCSVTVLSPILGCEYSETDPNDWSIIMRVEYGENAMIFTADATVHAEQLSMFHNEHELFAANVLKVAHHGSTTSSSLGFIETVGAGISVISVGQNNPYGHPDFDIVRRLETVGSSIYRTDAAGSIALFFDGKSVEVKTEKQP